MERYSLLLVAPPKLKDLGKELENINKLEDKSIFMQVRECSDLKTLPDYDVFQDKNEEAQDFILLFESITENRSNIEKAHTELLDWLRKVKFSKPIKIVVVMQKNQENELLPFVNELIKLDIQDFYFINGFMIEDIMRWLFIESKNLKDNQKYINTKIAAKGEKEVVIREVPKYIEVPVDDKKRKKFSFRMFGARDEGATAQNASTKIIGVVSSSPGAGATSLTVGFAEYLHETFKSHIAVIERNDSKNLLNYNLKNVDIYSCPLHEVELAKYDYIIIDFGILYHLTNEEPVMIKDTREEIQEKLSKYGLEKKYCNKIIIVCPALPWKINEVKFFLDDVSSDDTREWVFYFNGNPENKEFNKFMKSYYEESNMIFSYNNEKLYYELLEIINK